MGVQPVRQGAQVPERAEVDAELEQAELVQRHLGAAAAVAAVDAGNVLDRVVVGDQGRQAAGTDPRLQVRIAAVERGKGVQPVRVGIRSEEHTSELQSLMRTSYAVFCLKKKNQTNTTTI